MNTLREAVEEYLSMRRHLGFKLHDTGRGLRDFVKFMEKRQASFITQSLALTWAQQPMNVQPAHWAKRMCFVRGFARHRSADDPRTEVPSPGLLPFRSRRATPHLYSDEEVKNLLNAALNMPYRYERGALLPWTYFCLFGVLCVSGLRVGEACDLELRDVDLDAAVLIVREAKFGRTRLVPLHSSTCDVIAEYIARRRRHWAGRSVSSYLFVSSRGNPLDGARIRRTFCSLSRQVGLRGQHDHNGPRLHDFRHRFATRTLVNWYRGGKDPERLLPVLSAYLGHVHIADTQWYLEGSPELMSEAMRRLDNHWEDRS